MADTYTVERSETIAAAPESIFAKVSDLTQWDDWSPWAEMDPDMDTEHGGTPGAVGSSYAWKGNRKVGEGSMMVTNIDAPSRVDVDLKFLKPFKAENDVEWLIEPADDGSRVTWRMHGQVTFMTRVMALFGKTMDKMVGPDFEQGLAKLKRVVEA